MGQTGRPLALGAEASGSRQATVFCGMQTKNGLPQPPSPAQVDPGCPEPDRLAPPSWLLAALESIGAPTRFAPLHPEPMVAAASNKAHATAVRRPATMRPTPASVPFILPCRFRDIAPPVQLWRKSPHESSSG
jgi:hypothetical protein